MQKLLRLKGWTNGLGSQRSYNRFWKLWILQMATLNSQSQILDTICYTSFKKNR